MILLNWQPNLYKIRLFHPYFLCLLNFQEISMIIVVIWGQNKLFCAILKIPLQKNCSVRVSYSLKPKMISTQPIFLFCIHLQNFDSRMDFKKN